MVYVDLGGTKINLATISQVEEIAFDILVFWL